MYDFVFHGNGHFAKGLGVILDLAKELPERKFLLPMKRNEVDKISSVVPSNVYIKNMSWGTGLKEEIKNATIVLHASIWSSPIEGALIKSIKYNGMVAVLKTEYSFYDELSENIIVGINPDRLSESSQKLSEILNGSDIRDEYKMSSQLWHKEFIAKNCNVAKRILDIIRD